MTKKLIAAIAVMTAWSMVSAAELPAGQAIQATGPKAPLNGTFQATAVAATAVVVILPGSGPTDRNGNNPLGIRAAPYQWLAAGLAQAGIASIRADKRGLLGSGGAIDGDAVTLADYVTDTRNWIAAARAKTPVKCVWLLGHSEGGLIALLTAQNAANICGVLLVAAPGRSFDVVLRDQLGTNPGFAPMLPDAFKTIDQLKAGKRVDVAGLPPALKALFATQVQGYLIDLFRADPAKLMSGLKMPVLIVQGQQDIQVSEADANLLKAAKTDARLMLLAGVNHVLKPVPPNNRQANIAAYSDPDLPIAPSVVEAITKFVRDHP